MPADVRVRDLNARRGLRLSVLGAAIVPLTVIVVAIAPAGARAPIYVAGLAVTAVVSITGGTLARRALGAGTSLRGRAITGATLGLWLGFTAAIVCFLALVGTAL
jgi:hypothetical protein